MYYKLIDAIQVPVAFVGWKTGRNGVKTVCHGRLVPNREYYDYVDDPVYMSSLQELYHSFDWSRDLEEAVQKCGARYELPERTCSCQRQKINVWYVEVVE